MRGLGIGIITTALLMGVATGKGIPLSDAEIKARALELGMVESDSLKLTDVVNTDAGESGDEADGSSGSGEAGGSEGSVGAGDVGSPGDSAGSEGSEGSAGVGESGSPGDSAESEGSEDSAGAGESGGPGDSAGSEGSEGSAGVGDADSPDGREQTAASETSGEENDGNDESTSGDVVTVVIEFGVTSYHVSEILAEAGLVEDAGKFDEYLCASGLSRKITAGTYEIRLGTDEEELIKIITKSN